MSEGIASDEDGNTGKDRIEDVERAHCADAHEVKQSAFDAQIREGLMQALEDPVAPAACGVCLHESPSHLRSCVTIEKVESGCV